MILGLTGSLVSVIPMSCGIFLYYVILYVKQNGSFLAGSEQTEITQMLAQVIKNLLAERDASSENIIDDVILEAFKMNNGSIFNFFMEHHLQ